MMDHRKALADIDDIRSQMAASTTFHGFGPAALMATGIIALTTALIQSFVLDRSMLEPWPFLTCWIAVAVFSVFVIGAEMVIRTRRRHSGLADAMIYNAVQQFLPAGAAGAAIAAVVFKFSTETSWILPGLWAILVGIGIFPAARTLPRGTIFAGAWYFVSGCVVLMMAASEHAVSPWFMGIPFAVGQFLLAGVIYRAGDGHVE